MATEIQQVVHNITAFYDFAGKTVVCVGAGGGQLVELARPAGRVIAIDKDATALARLASRLFECGLTDKFTILEGELLGLRPHGDVVVFEFCLHEMADPDRALVHPGSLAPDVLVFDHAPGSLWEWYAAENEQVETAWKAVERRAIRRQQNFEAVQRFPDYAALEARFASQSPENLKRISRLHGQRDLAIPMPYRLALL